MRTRKVHLKPETFPFLAVLLCAMGALILLLLVMDRRAKIVAQNKARLDRAQQLAANQQDQSRRQAEIQRQQDLFRQWNRQAGDQLALLQNVQTQAITSAKTLDEEQARQRQLQQQALEIGERVRQLRDDIAQRQRNADRVAKNADGARSELERQLIKLRELQSTLEGLKARALLEQHTYSLIPYSGKYGDNRKPLYIECTISRLIFHPDRLELQGLRTAPRDVRAEVERRIDRLRLDGKTKPYLMVLVRPSGIESYSLLRLALEGMEIDFGYELIEADWLLDFSVDVVANGPPIAPILPLPPVPPPLARIRTELGGWKSVPGSAIGKSGLQGNGPGTGAPGVAGTSGSSGPGTGDPGVAVGNGSSKPRGGGPGGVRLGGELPTSNGSMVSLGPPSSLNPGGGGLASYRPGSPGGYPGRGGDGEGGWGLGGGGKSTILSNGAPKLADLVLGGGASGGTVSGTRGGFGTGMPGFGSGGSGGSGPGGNQGISAVAAPNYGGGNSPQGVRADGPPGNGSGGGGSAENANLGYGPPGDRQPGSGSPNAGSSGGNNGMVGGDRFAGNPNGVPGQQQGSPNSSPNPPSGEPMPRAITTPDPLDSANRTANSGNSGPGSPGGGGGSTGGGGPGNSGGGDSTGSPGSGTASMGGMSGMGVSPMVLDRNPGKRPPVTLSGLTGNRDWYIAIGCEPDGVVVRPTGQRFALADLTAKTAGESPLTRAVRILVERRQATVRPGETPYRPLLRLQVAPGGLGTYYLAYPLLVPLRYTMEREGVH